MGKLTLRRRTAEGPGGVLFRKSGLGYNPRKFREFEILLGALTAFLGHSSLQK